MWLARVKGLTRKEKGSQYPRTARLTSSSGESLPHPRTPITSLKSETEPSQL
jgi:hypothetical protein